jgi:hypothetical protein
MNNVLPMLTLQLNYTPAISVISVLTAVPEFGSQQPCEAGGAPYYQHFGHRCLAWSAPR